MDILIGTPLIDMSCPSLKDKFLVIDMGVNGARELKQRYKNAIFIYIIPPTKEKLLSQMKDRDPSRLLRSKSQLPNAFKVCKWLVINDNPENAAMQIERIMTTLKTYSGNVGKIDRNTMEFLYSCSFHSPKNRDFLQKFYGDEISQVKERE